VPTGSEAALIAVPSNQTGSPIIVGFGRADNFLRAIA
jgi:hypothetical protein